VPDPAQSSGTPVVGDASARTGGLEDVRELRDEFEMGDEVGRVTDGISPGNEEHVADPLVPAVLDCAVYNDHNYVFGESSFQYQCIV
jgi:hypothetical protein